MCTLMRYSVKLNYLTLFFFFFFQSAILCYTVMTSSELVLAPFERVALDLDAEIDKSAFYFRD